MAPRPRAQTASSRAVPRTIDLEAGINRALLTVGGERKGRCERRRAEVDEADQQFERAAGRSRYWLAPWRSGPGGTDGCGRPGQQRAREGGAHVTSPKRKLAQDRHRDRSDRPPPGRSPSVERSHGGGRPLLLPTPAPAMRGWWPLRSNMGGSPGPAGCARRLQLRDRGKRRQLVALVAMRTNSPVQDFGAGIIASLGVSMAIGFSPSAATFSPRWWPSFLPAGGHEAPHRSGSLGLVATKLPTSSVIVVRPGA
jgi:hypothetical protein